MTPSDDELSQRLQALPTATQRSVSEIESRARTLRRRRRAGGASVAVVAVAMAAGVLVTGWITSPTGGVSAADSATTAPVECPRTVEDAFAVVNDAVNETTRYAADPAEAPDALRLLWSPSVAPAPTTASASDVTDADTRLAPYEAECPALPMRELRVVAVADDTVTRGVTVAHVDVPYVAHEAPEVARTLDAGSVDVQILESEPGKDLVSARWGTDEESWTAIGSPLSDAEIIDLARTAHATADGIVLDEWGPAAEADHVTPSTGGNAAAGAIIYEASNDAVHLTIRRSSADLWQRAKAGAQLIEVGEKPGLLHDDGDHTVVTWQVADDIVADLGVRGDATHAHEIAESVVPTSADDSRLVASWQ